MKKKILVVDDSPVVLAMIEDMLSELNYDVTVAENGFDASRQVEQQRFNLIITDLNMPVMSGIEFAKKAKLIPNCRFVPIVMLSSENDQDKIAEAKKMGISTFLSKPIKENQLKALLQVVMGS